MKKISFILTCVLLIQLRAQTYQSFNINLLGIISPCNVNNWYASGSNTKYSSVVGWANPADQREYAILGATDGYYFIEVTNPTAPVVRDFESGINPNCLWREMKTYGNYCYLVSDDASPNGMIIADLSYLPDSVHIISKGNSILTRSHTVFIDGNKLYCGYINTTSAGQKSMAVYSLANPTNPTLLRFLDSDYPSISSVHDMWVQNDTVFASCGNDGLHIYHFDDTQNKFFELASYTGYIQAGYNHSSFRTADKKTLVFCDEVPTNTVVKILDVSNLSNLTLLDTIKSNQGATPHNPYIVGNDYCFVAYYQDGLYVFNISNPNNVFVAGYFDTHYQNGVNNGFPGSPTPYMGAWAADPFLPSGNVLVSDMQNGLFILDAKATGVGIKKNENYKKISVQLFPNPAHDNLELRLINGKGTYTISISDVNGKQVMSKKLSASDLISNVNIPIENLSPGIYFVQVTGDTYQVSEKFIRE